MHSVFVDSKRNEITKSILKGEIIASYKFLLFSNKDRTHQSFSLFTGYFYIMRFIINRTPHQFLCICNRNQAELKRGYFPKF